MVLAENSYSPGTARARVGKNKIRNESNKPRNKHVKTLLYFQVITDFGGWGYYQYESQVALGCRLAKRKAAMLQRLQTIGIKGCKTKMLIGLRKLQLTAGHA